MGLCNLFRSHERNFVQIGSPLHKLTSNETKWKRGDLTKDCLKAFNQLKMFRTSSCIPKKKPSVFTNCGCCHRQWLNRRRFGRYSVPNWSKRCQQSNFLCKQAIIETRKTLHTISSRNGSYSVGNGTLWYIPKRRNLYSILWP
jgi:hypothetical protein